MYSRNFLELEMNWAIIGDFDKAVECHMDHLSLAESLDNKVEAARAYK